MLFICLDILTVGYFSLYYVGNMVKNSNSNSRLEIYDYTYLLGGDS